MRRYCTMLITASLLHDRPSNTPHTGAIWCVLSSIWFKYYGLCYLTCIIWCCVFMTPFVASPTAPLWEHVGEHKKEQSGDFWIVQLIRTGILTNTCRKKTQRHKLPELHGLSATESSFDSIGVVKRAKSKERSKNMIKMKNKHAPSESWDSVSDSPMSAIVVPGVMGVALPKHIKKNTS